MAMLRLLLFLFIILTSHTKYAGAQVSRGHSPSKSIQVELVQKEQYTSRGEGNIDDISHVKYDVLFKNEQGKELAKATYADVYGWDSLATPMDPARILQLLEWSPEEDFVILPPEEWAGYMGPFSIAWNLRADRQWRSKEIVSIDGWLSPTRFYSSQILDCDMRVLVFDAVSGRETIVREDQGVFGYLIIENDGQGIVVIKSEPNNCANREQREQFQPTCELWNLNTLAFEKAECKN